MPQLDPKLSRQLESLGGKSRELRRGEILFREGEQGDTLFLLSRGRLRAVVCRDRVEPSVVGEIAAGEILGELAVLCAAPRSATVVAIRDSVVVEISGDDLSRLEAPVLLELMRQLGARMREMIDSTRASTEPRCIALVGAAPDLPLTEIAEELGRVAAPLGKHCLPVRPSDIPEEVRAAGLGSSVVGDWLSQREEKAVLILQSDYEAGEWTLRCLLQADLVIVVARAWDEPCLSPAERALAGLGDDLTRPNVDLLLLQRERPFRGTARWLEHRRVRRHFHVRPSVRDDRERMARQVFGANLSVALGGGGARGFAHVGVLRACEELNIPLDRIGGTSIGSIVGGLAALGFPAADVKENLRRGFVPARKLKEWSVPVISFDTSRRYQEALHRMYGDAMIEDLPINFFCVSCNLTRARSEIHRSGPLWQWVGASISYPLIAPPLVVGGEMLVDGGLMNNVPVDVARRDGAGFVLGVDVGASNAFRLPGHYHGRPRAWEVLWSRVRRGARRPGAESVVFPTMIDLISRTCVLGSLMGQERARPDADLYLRMPVEKYRLLDFDYLDEIADVGHQAALASLEPVREWQRRITSG